VCRQYGISHSHFLGGAARWTDEDQDKAVEYERYLRAKCGACNTAAAEWENDPFAYVGHSWRCPGCEVLEQERSGIPEGEKGVHVGLVPRDVAEALEDEARKGA
jgi:hypothetical protein